MNNDKIIIGLLIVIIIMLIGGIFLLNSNHEKIGTKIAVTSNFTVYENGTFSIRLVDVNNTPLSNQNVNITAIKENGDSKNYTVCTNSSGDASLELKGLTSGNYTVEVRYGGNDNYTACNATQKIEIKEKEIASETNAGDGNSPTTSNDDSYWETSPDAPFEYHTEYYPDGKFRQYDRSGRLVGSSYDEDQEKVADTVGRRI